MLTRLPWIGALGALIALPHIANAADCPTFTDQIVVAGSTAVEPLINAMAAALAPTTTIVYGKTGSCNGVNSVVFDDDTTQCKVGACLAGGSTVQYFDPAATTANKIVTCTLPAGVAVHVDVGLSDVAVDTCTGSPPAAGKVKDQSGPVEPMVFVVPKASQQSAITAEEAYFVFGYGTAGRAMPWTIENNLAVRNASSGTEQIIAHEINVPAGRWKGVDAKNSGGVVTAISTSTTPDSSLGILGSDVYDINRDKLKALAYQTYHQRGAFFPDSTATSFDKRNVRNGHYLLFGYLHMVTRLDSSGAQSAAAKRFVDWVTGNTASTPAPFNITTLTIQAKLIPTCAMKVSRTSEGGLISPYTPAADCGAAFEAAVGQ